VSILKVLRRVTSKRFFRRHDSPKVSVIVPFYNPGAFLEEAVESVRRQTLQDWELILVDDGSTDQSAEYARRQASADHRIRLVSHAGGINRGAPASRNLGAHVARGKYFANLDHDDIFGDPEKLEKQCRILDMDEDIGITFGPWKEWASWEPGAVVQDFIQQFTFPLDAAFEPPGFVPLLLSGKNDPHGYLVRASCFHAVGGYDDRVHFCEDWVLYFKLALRYRIFVSRENSYFHRRHQLQTVALAISDLSFFARFDDFFPFAELWLRDHHSNDTAILNEIRRAREFFQNLDRKSKESGRVVDW
jgi:glycosyltransferase involved in cell wall biosynthesis